MKRKSHKKGEVKEGRRARKTGKRIFIEPEIIAQEPLKRVVQYDCTISSTVLCFG